jgi:probable F420-dependent oxidoreductase
VEVGVFTFVTDETIGPAELARAVEERGFESLFLPEHTHIPASRLTPRFDGDLPPEYSRTLDPFLALTAAAAATSTLVLGTGACLVIERDPIVTAKEVATLDRLCGGRFLFGVAGGWNREEMRNHGTDPATRWDLLRERVEAMKAIWTEEAAEYHGRFVDFDPIWSWPKPLQRPHPPVLVAGFGPNTLDRVIDYGDGWMPVQGQGGDLAPAVAELRRRARERGRPRLPVTAFGAEPTAAGLASLAEMGVDRAVIVVATGPPDVVLPELDAHAALLEGVAH